jgi:hypothetical protein
MTEDDRRAWEQLFDHVWNNEEKVWRAQSKLKARASIEDSITGLIEERRELDRQMDRIHRKLQAMRDAYRKNVNPIIWNLTWVDTE